MVNCLLSISGMVVCGARTHPAPLPHVPPISAWSTVMVAAEAENMQAKQAATLLNAHPDIQPAHDSEDEEDCNVIMPYYDNNA